MAMKVYTLEEMEDRHIGKKGTPERDRYEQELSEELHAYHLGEAIKEARLSRNMTQEQLGEKIGVSKSAVAKWEIDGGLPDRDNMRRLSEVINVSVDELHRIIDSENINNTDLKVNITPEVIATLESYGYKVIRPGEE